MTGKLTTSSSKRHAVSPSGQIPESAQHPHRDAPVFKLSFDIEPVLSVVLRHVKLSHAAQEAITRELIEMMNSAVVQPQATGYTATASQDNPQLTTEQAAQLAGVSRPYMVKLIDTGAIQLHQRVGNQRRVLHSSVLRWQHIERVRQAKALTQLATDLDEEMFSP